jgi:mannose/fructose/N-acetylgalactosamine-specific phosphotransferase system component IIC
MNLPLDVLIALLVWGTLVGVDLVSLPQMMIARPIVAGTVAGAILGDIPTGLRLGVVFELMQYDILPVGAVRYPEYGPATVAAVATAHSSAGVLGLGLGALVGLATGLAGGLTINVLRRVNSRIVHNAAAALESGDPRALLRVHAGGLLRDALRAALVTALGLLLAWLARPLLAGALTVRGALLLAVATVAAAIAAGASGTLRLVGKGPNLVWFAAGLGGGLLVVAGVAWLR